MAATKSVFSPELRGKLAEKQRYLTGAQKAISQFARFPGPDDEYYFRLAKVTAGVDRKTQGFKFNFKFVCVANKKTRDPEFAGAPMNVTFRCFTTKNSTEEENWNRFYTDGLQALGYQTAKWPADKAAQLLDEALSQLNEVKPPVVLRIRTDGQFQNANIVEVLKSDALDEFAQPSLEVSDEMPDDEDEGLSPEDQQLQQLSATLTGMDKAKLVATIEAQKIPVMNAASLTDDQLRDAVYKHFEAQLKGAAAPKPAPESTPAATTNAPHSAPQQQEEVLEEVEESLEEVEEVTLDTPVLTTIATMERKPVQLYIKKLMPDRKFFPSESDALLKETLFGLLSNDELKKAFLHAMNVPF